jgi:hypothetical protein
VAFELEEATSDPLNVLIICRHNSGRSQIAETYLKNLPADASRSKAPGWSPLRP